jgi:putative PIN family toxin of toxin-antitoxin system
MNPDRILLDTNVLISAALSVQGKPAKCLDWTLDHATLLTSTRLLSELETRLARPRLAKYLTEVDRRTFMTRYAQSAVTIDVEAMIKACRDPDDDHLLDVAIGGRAGCLVTGDLDLLVLHPFSGLPILSPANFLNVVGIELP